ncbi:hypothetical protein [Serratia fonticola]|uniref:Uncharacterized protein n=1 Tax=Serratia fonticola TaxID=47917 RepID=A0A3S5AUF8_SERFO|nr:Uncharacterised protein [Serratia fonticola]
MSENRVTASFIDDPLSKIWFTIHLDEHGFADIDRDIIGRGSVDWGGVWHDFSLYEYDEKRAGLDWLNPEYSEFKATLDVFDRRLAIGEVVIYIDDTERYAYRIEKVECMD